MLPQQEPGPAKVSTTQQRECAYSLLNHVLKLRLDVPTKIPLTSLQS
jgi:hypothetical protein